MDHYDPVTHLLSHGKTFLYYNIPVVVYAFRMPIHNKEYLLVAPRATKITQLNNVLCLVNKYKSTILIPYSSASATLERSVTGDLHYVALCFVILANTLFMGCLSLPYLADVCNKQGANL